MTTTAPLAPNGAAPGGAPLPAVRLDPATPGSSAPPAAVVPITRGTGGHARTVGVMVVDGTGARWQPTIDVERLVTVATVVAGLVAAHGFAAAALRRPTARVDRLTMGPGGWVSFKGGEKPKPHGPRRPWWAVLLRARPLDR